MWSMTRKVLYERLAPSLKGRVTYDIQTYQHLKCDCVMCADNTKQFLIILDGKDKNTIAGAGGFFRDQELKHKVYDEVKRKPYTIMDFDQLLEDRYFYYTGLMLFSYLPPKLHEYLNCAGIERCLSGEDYFLYLLAIFDRRVGKRRIKKIYEGIKNEPEWIRKYILFRAEAEGIHKHGMSEVI